MKEDKFMRDRVSADSQSGCQGSFISIQEARAGVKPAHTHQAKRNGGKKAAKVLSQERKGRQKDAHLA